MPCTREATLVHFVDNLGGNLGSFDRIERTLIWRVSDGAELAAIDGTTSPLWRGSSGALLARHETSLQLYRFDAQYANQGAVTGFVGLPVLGSAIIARIAITASTTVSRWVRAN